MKRFLSSDTGQNYIQQLRSTLKKSKPVSSSQDPLETVKEIIRKNKTKNPGFVDPSNSKLDLLLNNKTIYETILSEARHRTQKRFRDPLKIWHQEFTKAAGKSTIEEVKKDLLRAMKRAKISPDKANEPLSVGDLVALHEDSSNLYLVVSCPHRLDSNSYVFVNNEGEIVFGPKLLIKLRVPGVVPSEFTKIIGTFVQLERKSLGIAPIGISDSTFSRSNESLPEELKGTDNYVNMRSGQNSPDVEGDLIVAQASSQLLTDTNVNTYMVPTMARDMYSKGLVDLSLLAYYKIPVMSRKLESLHRTLQYENGDVSNSPKVFSVFQLLSYLREQDERITDSHVSSIGKTIPKESDSSEFAQEDFSISSYLALILSLRKQPRCWSLNQKNKSDPPLSVTLLPTRHVVRFSKLAHYLKFKLGDRKFAQYAVRKIKDPNTRITTEHEQEIISLLQDYVSGNLDHDAELETAIVTIIRLVDKALEHDPRLNSPVEYSYEYSRARTFDILQLLTQSAVMNPFSRSYSLESPLISSLSQLAKEYYQYLDSGASEDFCDDPYEDHREEYNEPVFCIDSETAHEIDDGISISSNGDKYVVSVHIADPTSYIKPFSNLTNIAFSKGSTVYLPEGPLMMLPRVVSDTAGLGIDGQMTSTFVIEYALDKEIVDSFRRERAKDKSYRPSQEFMTKCLSQIHATSNIKLGRAKNFPQGFTYNRVNEVLGDDRNAQLHSLNSLNGHAKPLFDLFTIATLLKEIRVMQGNGIEIDSSSSSITVEKKEQHKKEEQREKEGCVVMDVGDYQIIVQSNESGSMSQDLVSNLMIFANHAASEFSKRNDIPVIYRNQTMKLNERVSAEMSELSKQSYLGDERMTPEHVSQIISVLASARLGTSPLHHESLGLTSYATVTSPLRRFVDMVNHWNIKAFLAGSHVFQDHQLLFISNHLQSREMINQKIQKSSRKFWEGMFFKRYVELVNNGDIEPFQFRLLIKNDFQHGPIPVELIGFNSMRTRLHNSDSVVDAFNRGEIEVGQIFSGPLDIVRADFIEDELVFDLTEERKRKGRKD